MRRLIILASALFLMFGLVACEDTNPDATQSENKSRMSNYERLVDLQPAESMGFSPTRETKNFWIRTWDEKGKLSYVYLMNANGDMLGYYIFEGLPVSYCTGLIPPYRLEDVGGDGLSANLVLPAPSVDGTYSSGGNCNTFYGKDATSGAYIEYTVGMGINVLLFDQPMPRQEAVRALGDATVESVKKK